MVVLTYVLIGTLGLMLGMLVLGRVGRWLVLSYYLFKQKTGKTAANGPIAILATLFGSGLWFAVAAGTLLYFARDQPWAAPLAAGMALSIPFGALLMLHIRRQHRKTSDAA